MSEPASDGQRWGVAAWALAMAGLVVRLWVSWHVTGTNDIHTWESFATRAQDLGVWRMYGEVANWNHPPLMGALAAMTQAVGKALDLPFAFSFRLAPIAADALVMVALFRALWPKSHRLAALSVAVFALSPDAILVSGYHGNTDALVGAFVLLSALSLHAQRPGRAGLWLAAAINVKLIPLVLVPLLFAQLRTRRELGWAALGLSVGVIPFIPVLVTAAAAFHRNAIAYNSNYGAWGLSFLANQFELSTDPYWKHQGELLHGPLARYGRYVILGLVLGLAVLVRKRPKALDAPTVYALGLASFFTFAPGFGVQYTTILGGVLLAASLRAGVMWAVSAGAYVGATYFAYWTRAALVASWFRDPFPTGAGWVGIAAWVLLAGWAGVTVTRAVKAADQSMTT